MIPLARPYLTEEEAKSAYEVILSGWVTQGPKVKEFEDSFARYVGSKHAIAVSSCTTALHLALIISGAGPGDEVICPSLSFIATANSIVYTGAKPIFADVEKDTQNISPVEAEKLITDKTKAIMIVHQVGLPADIDSFKEICSKYKLVLIEDAACAIGSAYKEKKIGCHSELVCFSFHPRKVITTGDGGMITTSSDEIAERLRRLRQHGMSVSDLVRHSSKEIVFEEYLELGYNYRLTDIQAAIGIKQLEKIDWIISERRKIAECYFRELSEIECIELPFQDENYYANYQSFCIYLKKNAVIGRDELLKRLYKEGIACKKGIMTAHREPAFSEYEPKRMLPVSEDVSDNSITIPLYVGLKDDEVAKIIDSIKFMLGKT